MKRLPSRTTIPAGYTWNLSDIFQDPDAWEREFLRMEELLGRMGKFEGRLAESTELKGCLSLLDETYMLAEKLYSYAHLFHHTDLGNSKAQGLVNRVDKLMIDVREKISFIDPEILSLSPEKLTSLIGSDELSFYRFSLEKKLRLKPHTLSKPEEEIIARTGILSQLSENAFSMLNDADMVFPKIRDERDRFIELTHGTYSKCLESGVRRVRRDAFHACHTAYRAHQHTITSLFNGSVQKDLFYSRTLRYPSSLGMSLFDDNIPARVYENLIRTVHDHLPVFHRYLRVRKKFLRTGELHLYDLSVPIIPRLNFSLPYEETRTLVQKGLAPLGDEYGRIVRMAFDNRWIDVFESRGKHSGGYNWGIFGVHPYILLNYVGTLNDIFTVAHELGHAVHSYLSNSFQAYHYASYSIFIAEIASTLNEALLLHHLLETSAGPRRRLYFLSHFADTFRATVIVQTMFAEFEKIVHEKAEEGIPLTLEKLNEVYYGLCEKYYGSAVRLDREAEISWMRIPHFYQSFYVYKYATGFSAAQFLADRILSGDRIALDGYHELLKSGGKDYPLVLLKNAGVDMTVPAPLEQAWNMFGRVIDEMEKFVPRRTS